MSPPCGFITVCPGLRQSVNTCRVRVREGRRGRVDTRLTEVPLHYAFSVFQPSRIGALVKKENLQNPFLALRSVS